MIELKHIYKRYGDKTAVDDFSLTVPENGVTGLLGRNGAGKSTTMNMMTGCLPPSAGNIKVDGVDMNEQPEAAKKRLGYLPEQPPLYTDMTVNEYLRFAAGLKGIKGESASAQTNKVMEALSVGDMKNRLIRQLSKGYRQRVGIAQAVLGNPGYVILDEPTAGLDPVQIRDVRALIRELGVSCSVVFSSHILTEAADICHSVVIMHEGKIVANDSVDSLLNDTGRLIVRTDGEIPEQSLRLIPGVIDVRRLSLAEEGAWDYRIDCKPGADVRREIAAACYAAGIGLLMLRPAQVTMEEVFLQAIQTGEHAI